ncbi:hypothetical protein [Staphylococcus hominis]|uniref:hypothetical protein n=1 Tax=Staphylococcus hominis TaxID=1290 RepID=UPI00265C303F|nr:hypothetical protein [Staphylococcus hominis]MDO0983522.1 hypothetical protein [Staphylococcus hominis]
MIRLPNPGSDLDQMVKIFKILYSELSDYSSFTLDNMAQVMTAKNVASSNGFIGKEALNRSYATKDKSRNGIFNQAKMYAEVFRLFGWIASVEESALVYNFTYFGVHVVKAKNYKPIIEESLINMHFPNNLVNVKFDNKSSIFKTILLFIEKLENYICRDEIILGPMNIKDDRSNELQESVKYINSLRKIGSKEILSKALVDMREKNNISESTASNYTRIIVAALKYTGWTKEVRKKIYGRSQIFLELTEYGHKILNYLKNSQLIISRDLLDLSENDIEILSKIGILELLKRCSFDTSEDLCKLENEKKQIEKKFKKNVIFNPFQSLKPNEVVKYIPESEIENSDCKTKNFSIENSLIKEKDELREISSEFSNNYFKENNAFVEIYGLINQGLSYSEILEELYKKAGEMKQKQFYPLVADLFNIIFNLKSWAPQSGVNYERHDVIIQDEKYSIPVEVKSPKEEIMLSVKAIRQAVENKIIMLSRNNERYNTQFETASFAVGFNIPNKRSDVYFLIDDIKTVYNINIAIIDIKTLYKAAIYCILNNKHYKIEDFNNYNGVVQFEGL